MNENNYFFLTFCIYTNIIIYLKSFLVYVFNDINITDYVFKIKKYVNLMYYCESNLA